MCVSAQSADDPWSRNQDAHTGTSYHAGCDGASYKGVDHPSSVKSVDEHTQQAPRSNDAGDVLAAAWAGCAGLTDSEDDGVFLQSGKTIDRSLPSARTRCTSSRSASLIGRITVTRSLRENGIRIATAPGTNDAIYLHTHPRGKRIIHGHRLRSVKTFIVSTLLVGNGTSIEFESIERSDSGVDQFEVDGRRFLLKRPEKQRFRSKEQRRRSRRNADDAVRELDRIFRENVETGHERVALQNSEGMLVTYERNRALEPATGRSLSERRPSPAPMGGDNLASQKRHHAYDTAGDDPSARFLGWRCEAGVGVFHLLKRGTNRIRETWYLTRVLRSEPGGRRCEQEFVYSLPSRSPWLWSRRLLAMTSVRSSKTTRHGNRKRRSTKPITRNPVRALRFRTRCAPGLFGRAPRRRRNVLRSIWQWGWTGGYGLGVVIGVGNPSRAARTRNLGTLIRPRKSGTSNASPTSSPR